MEDCTRLDVVKANLRRDNVNKKTNKKVLVTKSINWNQVKTDTNSNAWNVNKNSLSLNEEQDTCSLDVSITFEKKLMKYVKNINVNLSDSEKRQPVNLTSNLVNELNTLSSLASNLAKKLSNEQDFGETQENIIEDQNSNE
jgi:hypothetical protein